MAKFDVLVQRYRNAAVYIEANTEDEAKELAWKKVGEMLQNGMFWGEEYYVITGASLVHSNKSNEDHMWRPQVSVDA